MCDPSDCVVLKTDAQTQQTNKIQIIRMLNIGPDPVRHLSREGSVATCVPLFVCSELGWKMSLDPEQTPLMFPDKETDPGVNLSGNN